MKIAILSHLKYPILRPFAGGLEMFTHLLTRKLVERGHDVTLFASGDSDSGLPIEPITRWSTIRAGETFPETVRDRAVESIEDHAYDDLMHKLERSEFDLIHNNTLHPTPLLKTDRLPAPVLTTLHVPPIPRMRAAFASTPSARNHWVANVSEANADLWSEVVPKQIVIHNGVETDRWTPVPTHRREEIERRAIWFGRITPEKGTHLAIEATRRAGLPLDIVGPISDEYYFRTEIAPRLGTDVIHLGHRNHADLARLVARRAVTVLSPRWNEPFGLVCAESLAGGTPVATFGRAGLCEVLDDCTGYCADADDVADLAEGIRACVTLDRSACRERAVKKFSIGSNITRYESLYERMIAGKPMGTPQLVTPDTADAYPNADGTSGVPV